MNKIQQQIQDQVVAPYINKLNKTTIGHIKEVDHTNLTATVLVNNPHGYGNYELSAVPIQVGSGGVSQSGPFIGDRVVIEFQNFNPHSPVITSVLDTNHDTITREQRLKHERKGAYLPDEICDRKDWTIGSNSIWG
jgi:hypothetical protein